jgi:hypothetical protein
MRYNINNLTLEIFHNYYYAYYNNLNKKRLQLSIRA